MSPQPHVIVFDLFGVIADEASPSVRAGLLAAAGGDVDSDAFWSAYWTRRPPYDTGAVSGPAYWRSVAAELGTCFEPWRIARLIDADCEAWTAVDPRMTDLVEELVDAGHTIGLLSNIPLELAAEFELHHPWLDRLSVVGFSARIGHAKPSPAAFHWCVWSLGAAPSEILFVDDREENVLAAETAGLRGHLFTGIDVLRKTIDALSSAGGTDEARAGSPAPVPDFPSQSRAAARPGPAAVSRY
jgi:putative hydrolase of the HAD superfamily